MTADRCDCCDLPAYSCGKATETAERRKRRSLDERDVWVPAMYPGKCVVCGERYDADNLISFVEGGWRSGCCV